MIRPIISSNNHSVNYTNHISNVVWATSILHAKHNCSVLSLHSDHAWVTLTPLKPNSVFPFFEG